MGIFRLKEKSDYKYADRNTKSYLSMPSSSNDDTDVQSLATTNSRWSRVKSVFSSNNKSSNRSGSTPVSGCININKKKDQRRTENKPIVPNTIEAKQLDINEESLVPRAIDMTLSDDSSTIASASTVGEATATIGALAAATASVANLCFDDNSNLSSLYHPTSIPTQSEVVRPVLYRRDMHIAGGTNTSNKGQNLRSNYTNQHEINNISPHSNGSIAASSASVASSYFDCDSQSGSTTSKLYKRNNRNHIYDDISQDTKLSSVPQLTYLSSTSDLTRSASEDTFSVPSAACTSTLPSYSMSGSMAFQKTHKRNEKKKAKVKKNPYNASVAPQHLLSPPKPTGLPSNSIMGSMLFRTMEHGGNGKSHQIVTSTKPRNEVVKHREVLSTIKPSTDIDDGFSPSDSSGEDKENIAACNTHTIASRPNSIFSMFEATSQLDFGEEDIEKSTLCEA